jgi:glycosyltransferase involved in cell wall biosynthesis
MKFCVGITVLNQYDELLKCVESVLGSTLMPENILIWDNGGKLKREMLPKGKIQVFNSATNFGVARAWNNLIAFIHPLTAIILNDDCEVAPNTFDKLMAVPGPALVNGLHWSCFRQDQSITELVGKYDEQFWPAYYEDCDYAKRILLANANRIDLGNIVKRHGNHGDRPYQNFTPDELAEFQSHVEKNKARFIQKWGGLPSEVGI